MLARLRTKLILLVLLPVIPALTVALDTNLRERHLGRAGARERVQALAQLAAAHQAKFIDDTRQLLTTLTDFPFLVLGTNRAVAETHLFNLRLLSPDYANFGLVEAEGTLFCSAARTNDGREFDDAACFQQVMRTRQFAVGGLRTNGLTAEPVLDCAWPVVDSHQVPRRVLFASLKVSRLARAAAQMPLPAQARVTVLDREGNVLARHPDAERLGGRGGQGLPFVRQILARGAGLFESPGPDAVPRLYAVTSIPDGHAAAMFVAVGIPVAISVATADRRLLSSLVVMALVAGIALTGAGLYAEHSILQPIQRLLAAAKRLAGGDFAARTGLGEGAGELHRLAGAFDEMAAALQQRQEQVERAQAEVQRSNAQLEQRVAERTAQLQAANQELESFSYSVSHDLRAPLRHIDGFARMLEDHAGPALDAKGRRYVTVISEAAKKMGTLIDDLLVFSRMGRQELRYGTVESGALVRQVIQELEPETNDRRLEWRLQALPPVAGDTALLRQVWLNLLGNAVKYTRTRPHALIEVGTQADGPAETVFFVRDNGVGFEPQYVGKLFGVFQRLHAETEFEGTGIGLANVRRIISRHGGRTWAAGQPDAGATFFFSLPHFSPPEL